MKYHNVEGINLILAILGCSAFGFPSEDPARSNQRPFGGCKTYYLGDTKDSVTDFYEMHDESLLAIFPIEVEKVKFQIELHMQETIFRLTLGRTSFMFEKCNSETKRCIVENEEEIGHDEYIQSFKWITIKLMTVNQELVMYVGSRLVMSMSLENYPDVSKTWIARFKRVKDYKATKNPDLNANEIRYHEINYLVQFKCQDYEPTTSPQYWTSAFDSTTKFVTSPTKLEQEVIRSITVMSNTDITAPDHSSTAEITAPDPIFMAEITATDPSSTAEVTAPEHSSTVEFTAPDHSSTAEITTPDHSSTAEIITPDHSSTAEITAPDHSSTAEITAHDHFSSAEIKAPDHSSTAETIAPDHFYTAEIEIYNETTPVFSVTESTSTPNVFIQIPTADDYERPWTHSSTDKESENESKDSAAEFTTESTLTDEYATMDVYLGEYELPMNTAIIEGSTTNYNTFTTNPYLEAITAKPDHFEMMSEFLYTSLTVVVAFATIIAFILYCLIKKRRSAALSQDTTTSPDDKRKNSDDGFFEHETSASKEGEYCHCDPVPSSEQV